MTTAERTQDKSTWEKPTVFYNEYVKWLVYTIIVAFFLWSVWEIQISLERFVYGIEQGAHIVDRGFPPDFGPGRREQIWADTWETVAMAIVATVFGIAMSVPVAIMASRNLVPEPVFWIGRTIVACSRAFHVLIIAIIAVMAVGFGPLAGIITMSIKTIGFFAKLLAEEIEDIDPVQFEAVKATGASAPQVLVYGVLPQVSQRFVALTIYRWDINLRSSAIIGIVGAGGIGQLLLSSFNRFEYDFGLAILLVIIALVLFGEVVSAVARKRIEKSGGRGVKEIDRELTADRDTWDRFTSKQQFTRYGFVGFSFAIFVASWFYLNMSLEYIWTGPAALGDLFSRMFPPNPVIIPEMVGPLLTSIHIAILGTVFSIVLSVPVAFIAADKTSPNRYTYGLGKVIITVSRSVHEIIWTLLFVVMFGPGALAGVLALSVRSVGFIGKLLNEAIEEIDMTQVEAMKATGAGTAKTFVYAIVPQVMPAFIGIATYRWDSNVRASTVVGFVGGGGIGVLLMDTINTFRWAEAVVILGAILSVVLFSEVVSAYLRKKVM